MVIKAVVFDIGGVLERVDDDSWPHLWLSKWTHLTGVNPTRVDQHLAQHEPENGAVTGAFSEAEFRRVYADALGLDDRQADLMMAEMWDGYCGELDVVLRDYCASLRPAYITAILSNSADGARREEQRRYGFEQLVDVIIYSHEVGLAKPDPAVFRLTEERLGVRPKEIAFVDDQEQHVLGAEACGWWSLLHSATDRTIAELDALLDANAPERKR